MIIGGGIAGGMLAKAMQFHADVVLIDPYVQRSCPHSSSPSPISVLVGSPPARN